jgi:hypothetical protein
MAFARFELIAFHAKSGRGGEKEGDEATSVGAPKSREGENPFAIFIGTYVSSHKSCFAKLTFPSPRPLGPHTKRDSFSIPLFVNGYLMAVAKT